MDLCPYCRANEANTDDHIFPQFLGGKRTVRACKRCNDLFGRQFEGPVSKSLAPLIVALAASGYKHPRRVRHEKAWVDAETNVEYDMFSDLTSSPNKPQIIEEDGKIKRVIARSEREARVIQASLVAKNKATAFNITNKKLPGQRPPLKGFQFSIGQHIRQLALKMCVGCVRLTHPQIEILTDELRTYLLDKSPSASPVRESIIRSPELDERRPPLGHLIMVHGSPGTKRVVSIVHLFGAAFQFFVELRDDYSGDEFTSLATFDIRTLEERYAIDEAVQYAEPPRFGSMEQVIQHRQRWGPTLNEEIQRAFGHVGINLGSSPIQQASGVTPTIPVLWIEHEVTISLQMELVAESTNQTEVHLPNNPHDWRLSSDGGRTVFNPFTEFLRAWNSNEIPREKGLYEYRSRSLDASTRLLFEPDFWVGVAEFSFTYSPRRVAWEASLAIPLTEAELNLDESSVSGKFTIDAAAIPKQRDPAWPQVADLDAMFADSVPRIALEVDQLNAASLKFNFRLR